MSISPELSAKIADLVAIDDGPSHSTPQVFDVANGGNEMAMGGAYEASRRHSRELAMYNPALMSADVEILPAKGAADARIRDSIRNDAYVANGARTKQDSIVGEMFMLNSKPNFKVLGLDETWAEEFQEEIESKFTLYAESPRNYVDAQRKMTLTDMVRLAVGIMAANGEVLASAEWLRDSPRPYSSALQMISVDRLSNPTWIPDSAETRAGIKRNKFGAPIGYYIRKAHPSDYTNPELFDWRYVPATKALADSNYPNWDRQMIIHIVSILREDQTRGISPLVSALKEMRMTKKYRDISLQAAALNASYAASIESALPSTEAFAAIGGSSINDLGAAVGDYASQYLAKVAEYSGASSAMHMDGLKIPHFFPGTSMKIQNAGTPGGLGTNFEQSMMRYLAAAFGMSYEAFSKDYAQANYSNLRAAIADQERRDRVDKRIGADRFATAYFRLWLEEALNKGEITSMPRNAPNWYEGMNADAYSACSWIGANQGQIDELKETQAAVLRLKNNLSTLEDEQARLGKDWRVTLRQRKREVAVVEDYGLAPPEKDNMMNAASGSPTDTGKDPDDAEK